MQMREQVIHKLQAALAREQDAGRVKKIQEQIALLASAELAELKTRPAPLYPVGAVGQWDGKRVTVTGAAWRDGRWHYTVEVDAGAFIRNFHYSGDEESLKLELASRVGAPAGPAYPAGVTFMRGQVAAKVLKVEKPNGTYVYTIAGFPRPVTQEELARALARG